MHIVAATAAVAQQFTVYKSLMFYELLRSTSRSRAPFSMRTVATGAQNVVANDEQLILIARNV